MRFGIKILPISATMPLISHYTLHIHLDPLTRFEVTRIQHKKSKFKIRSLHEETNPDIYVQIVGQTNKDSVPGPAPC